MPPLHADDPCAGLYGRSWSELRMLVDSGQLCVIDAVHEVTEIAKKSGNSPGALELLSQHLALRGERALAEYKAGIRPNRALAAIHWCCLRASLSAVSDRTRERAGLDVVRMLHGALAFDDVDPYVERRHEGMLRKVVGLAERLSTRPIELLLHDAYADPSKSITPKELLHAKQQRLSRFLLRHGMGREILSRACCSFPTSEVRESLMLAVMRPLLETGGIFDEYMLVVAAKAVETTSPMLSGELLDALANSGAQMTNGLKVTRGWLKLREWRPSAFAHLFATRERRVASLRQALQNHDMLYCHAKVIDLVKDSLSLSDIEGALRTLCLAHTGLSAAQACLVMARFVACVSEVADQQRRAREAVAGWLDARYPCPAGWSTMVDGHVARAFLL